MIDQLTALAKTLAKTSATAVTMTTFGIYEGGSHGVVCYKADPLNNGLAVDLNVANNISTTKYAGFTNSLSNF